jgi:hypothetical protein
MARVLVGAVVAVHFGFIAYVAFGGVVAWWWPRTVVLHVAAVAWGCSTLAFGLPCPLTELENTVRSWASLALLGSDGFAGHYLAYESYRTPVRAVFAALVIGSWLVLAMSRDGRLGGAVARLSRPMATRRD